MEMHVLKMFASWGTNLCLLCYVYCYIHAVKTKVKLINALSAQTFFHPKSIAIWPATAQLCNSPSLWHCGQPGFQEAHLELSFDCESHQETSHNGDWNCQICRASIQLLLWNSSPELIKVHPAAHWVLGFSIHVAGIRASITGGEGTAVPQAIWWEEDITVHHPAHLLEAQNQVQKHQAWEERNRLYRTAL